MPTISFAYPWLALTALVILPVLLVMAKRRKTIGHSGVSIQRDIKRVPLVGYMPKFFLVCFMALLTVALMRPQLPDIGQKEVIQTRDFILATDISGSMDSEIKDPKELELVGEDELKDENGEKIKITKLLVAEKAIEQFVGTRKGDRIGLFLFNDEVFYSWPLSTDLKVILFKNKGVHTYTGGGTNFEGSGQKGSKMGPIQAAIEHFKELGQAKTKILVMVSDGEANISDQRFAELMEQMQEIGMKIYTIGVGDSWTKGGSGTQSLRKITEATGGLAIAAGDAEQMRQAFRTINELEKSTVEMETSITHQDIYQYFAFAAGLAMLLFLFSTVLIRGDN